MNSRYFSRLNASIGIFFSMTFPFPLFACPGVCYIEEADRNPANLILHSDQVKPGANLPPSEAPGLFAFISVSSARMARRFFTGM